MNDVDRKRLQNAVVNDLKQACLELSGFAGQLFDRLEEHGIDAAWEGDGALVIVGLSREYEKLREFFARQAIRRLMALGVPASALLDASHIEGGAA